MQAHLFNMAPNGTAHLYKAFQSSQEIHESHSRRGSLNSKNITELGPIYQPCHYYFIMTLCMQHCYIHSEYDNRQTFVGQWFRNWFSFWIYFTFLFLKGIRERGAGTQSSFVQELAYRAHSVRVSRQCSWPFTTMQLYNRDAKDRVPVPPATPTWTLQKKSKALQHRPGFTDSVTFSHSW